MPEDAVVTAPRCRLMEFASFEREVVLRMPFRFGVLTLRRCPQAFVRVRVRFAGGGEAVGVAAEMLVPKWFDKDPALGNDDNVEQLRRALRLARDAYLAETDDLTPFALHARHAAAHERRGVAEGLNPLVANFGTALVDRAVLDAACRHAGLSFSAALRCNLPGIDASTAPDLAGFDLDGFLARTPRASRIAARHTVGLVDAITEADIADADRLDDGLPQSLEACIAFYGCRHFKLKVRGSVEDDLDRLRRIAAVIDRGAEPYLATLDGNEQYDDVGEVVELWDRMSADPRLRRLCASIAFIEQPIARSVAFEQPVTALAERRPVEIDESDASMDSFLRARALGYAGVSSKQCKGIYRAVPNRARCALWNGGADGPCFMSGEDLVIQAGVALQQDLSLAAAIGCTHLERNGHHYVDGMKAAPAAEQDAFLAAHAALYHRQDGVVRLRIDGGAIDLRDLEQPGLGSAAEPDWAAMTRTD